jgi:hypothetical protein
MPALFSNIKLGRKGLPGTKTFWLITNSCKLQLKKYLSILTVFWKNWKKLEKIKLK